MIRISRPLLALSWALLLVAGPYPGTAANPGPLLAHRFMCIEYGKGPNRLLDIATDGRVVWEHRFPGVTVSFQILPSGNILYAHAGKPTGAREITRAQEVVWKYESTCPQALGCIRLPGGNTLLAEQGPCRAVEVNPSGTVVRTTPLTTTQKEYHLQVRGIRKLANGNILAAHEGEGAVREVDPEGRVVWEQTDLTNAGDALRLENGNTLISCGTQKRVIEVTPDHQVVWEFGPKDAPELNLTWVSSIQLLKNGNIVVGNFLRGQEGRGVHAFEVTRDKQVVWKFADHGLVTSLTTIRVLED
jgi:outer membrane protein assembly factor BamB